MGMSTSRRLRSLIESVEITTRVICGASWRMLARYPLAAHKLGLTQPTRSRQVAALEAGLGVTLVERVNAREICVDYRETIYQS